MRTLSDVERIKQIETSRRQESAITGLPPGYIFGLDLSIREAVAYISPGVASIRGKIVSLPSEVALRSDFWLTPRRPSQSYFVYLSVSGALSVERVSPVVEPGQYYQKNPITGARFLGELVTNDESSLFRVIARDPVYIGASATFEPGYNPKDKLDSIGGRYATAEGDRSKLEVFPDAEHALRVRRWDSLSSSYKDVLKILVDGQHEGDVVIGRYDEGFNGAKWDESESKLIVRGEMFQEDGSPYPTHDETSRFIYGEETPSGPYNAGDFWVQGGAIYIAMRDRGENEGSLQDWVWYIRPNIATDIQSTNGDKFRPGQSVSTTLIPRVFKNGLEITDALPDSAFSWKRQSFFPLLPPNDDFTWNQNHATGYRTIEVTTDSMNARATYTLEILE